MSNLLGDLISRGEGGYNSFNRGNAGNAGDAGDAGGQTVDFSQLTLGQRSGVAENLSSGGVPKADDGAKSCARGVPGSANGQMLSNAGAKPSASGARSLGRPALRLFTLCALILCLIVMNPEPASAQTKSLGVPDGNAPVRITGIYSDMAYSAQEGDLLGTEVFVVNTNRGYYVVFQSGEGEPTVPVVVPAEVSGSSIRFVLPPGVVGGTFTGTIGSAQLTGSFSSNKQVIHLKRKASYWQ